MNHLCILCGMPLGLDDEGLNRKLLGRDRKNFLCLACLAEHMGTTPSQLALLALTSRMQGCRLFRPYNEEESEQDCRKSPLSDEEKTEQK